MKNVYGSLFINFAFAGMAFGTAPQRLHEIPKTENGCELLKKVLKEHQDWLDDLLYHLKEIKERTEAWDNAQGDNLAKCANFTSISLMRVASNKDELCSSFKENKNFFEEQYPEDDPRGKYIRLFPLLQLILMNILESAEKVGWSVKFGGGKVHIENVDLNKLDQKSF